MILAAALMFASYSASRAMAADVIRIATQATGTFAWELAVIRELGLDRRAGLTIETRELASTEAGKIALRGGSADMILSDWLWVARERALGSDVVFYPYSSTLGAVMVPADSSIESIADLEGKKLGVAGGPLDKSWLLLQALALRSDIDLKSKAQVVYGSPPLLSAEALQGRTDATLTFWNFCAGLETQGMRRALSVTDVMKHLGAKGAVPMLGYVFEAGWAKRNRAALTSFFATAREAKDILAHSPEEWERLAPIIGAKTPEELGIYRQRYLEGIPTRSAADMMADAGALYKILAQVGGNALVGPARSFDPGMFYDAGAGE